MAGLLRSLLSLLVITASLYLLKRTIHLTTFPIDSTDQIGSITRKAALGVVWLLSSIAYGTGAAFAVAELTPTMLPPMHKARIVVLIFVGVLIADRVT
jgi:hypothetical protein